MTNFSGPSTESTGKIIEVNDLRSPPDDSSKCDAMSLEKKTVFASSKGVKTPKAMLAVIRNNPSEANILFQSYTAIDATDDHGQSALHLAFKLKGTHPNIIKAILRSVQNRHFNTEALAEKLFRTGCTLYHIAYLGDINLMKALMQRGVNDVDSTYYMSYTALHAAAHSNQVQLVACLLDLGANVNALGDDRRSALLTAAMRGNSIMVRLLLKYGADPNVTDLTFGITPLLAAMSDLKMDGRDYDKCVELLLQYDAVPTNRIAHQLTLFDAALRCGERRVNLLICCVALREMQGVPNAKAIMHGNSPWYELQLPRLQNFYKECQQILRMKVDGKLSLFDLLSVSDHVFRKYMRKKSFCYKVEHFLDDLIGKNGISCLYFYIMLNDRLDKAPGADLEQRAMSVLCQIFGGNYGQCYIFTRRIVDYLDKRDLQQFCKL